MVSRKAGSSDNEKQSAIVQQFALQQSQSQQPAAAAPTVISSSGFVPRSEDTEKAKAEQRNWDRAELLKVDEDDAQVRIYNAYSANANTSAEGVNSRRGLGAASEGAATTTGRGAGGRKMFVAAGGAPAFTPAATGVGTAATSAASAASASATVGVPSSSSSQAPWPSQQQQHHHQQQHAPPLPAGWSMAVDPASGVPYYANTATGVTQWHPPPPDPPALPAGWVMSTDPASFKPYFCNPRTGQTQWTPPAPQAPVLPPPTFAAAPAYPAASAAYPQAAPPSAEFAVKVRGLPPSMGDADVREIFGSCGRIVRVFLDRAAYSAGSAPKNATVAFDASASAELAVKQMNGIKMRSHTLVVELVGGAAAASSSGTAPLPPSHRHRPY